jgi:uncharacterized membrane protein YdjX (TVP38/TMEM64 family)
LGGYLAAVAASVTVLMLTGATVAPFEPPPVAEPALPSDWVTVAITFVMATLFVTVFAMPGFLLCLAVPVRAGLRHPAIHVACGGVIGLVLGHLFAGLADRPLQAAVAGAVGGAVYWWIAVRGVAGRWSGRMREGS